MVLKLLQKIILSQKKNYSPSSSSAWSAPWRRVLTLPLVILPVVWAHARPSLTFWNRGREAQRGGAASVARAHKRQSLSSFRTQLGDTRPDLFSKWTNQGAIKSIVDWCFMQRMDHDDPQLFIQLRWGSEFCNRIRIFLAWDNSKYTYWANKLPKWKEFSSNTKRFPPAGAGHWLEVTGVDKPGAINSCRTIPTTLTLCRHKHKHRSASVCQQKSQQVPASAAQGRRSYLATTAKYVCWATPCLSIIWSRLFFEIMGLWCREINRGNLPSRWRIPSALTLVTIVASTE